MPSPFDPNFTPEPLPAARRKMLADFIAEHGLAIVGGCAGHRADRMIISHTLGLTERGLPEVFAGSFPQQTAQMFLNYLSTVMPKSIGPDEDRIVFPNFLGGEYSGMLRRVPVREANDQILFTAREYYGFDVDVMQLVLEDKKHLYPWQPGCDEGMVTPQSPLVKWADEIRQ